MPQPTPSRTADDDLAHNSEDPADRVPVPPVRRSASWRRRLVKSAAALGAILILVEFTLRWLGLATPLLLQADPEIGYVFQANQTLHTLFRHTHINEFHQRSKSPGAGRRRILMIGDSVTFGGVMIDQSETITSHLESELESAGFSYQVLNASAGSWGLPNQSAYLNRFGLFDADVLIVQVGTHDLFQPRSTGDIIDRHPAFPSHKPMIGIVGFLQRYALPRIMPSDRREIPVGTDSPEQIAIRFQHNMEQLQDIFDLAKTSGTTTLVVHTPNLAEVLLEQTEATSAESYRQRFLALCAQNEISCLNLNQEWRSKLDEVAKYYRDDIHLTTLGNVAVAKSLTASLLRMVESHDSPLKKVVPAY